MMCASRSGGCGAVVQYRIFYGSTYEPLPDEANVFLPLTEYTTINSLDAALRASQWVLRTGGLACDTLVWRSAAFEALPKTAHIRQIARLGR